MRKFLLTLVVILMLAAAALGASQFLNTINITRQAQNNSPSPSPVLKIEGTSLALTPTNSVITTQENLPVLYLPGARSFKEGQIVSDNVVIFVTKLASLLAKTDFPPATIRVITEREIIVYDAQELTAVFTAEKEANSQVDSLQQTLAAAKIDGDKITKIDLRFEKPVITFK